MALINQKLTEIAHSRNLNYLAYTIGLFGITYLIWKLISLQGTDLTFRYIWIAGSIWSQGLNPYGPEYFITASNMFETFNGQPFYYPPNWWGPAQLLAIFEYQVAMEIWRFLNVTLILLSSLLLNRAFRTADIPISNSYLAFYTGLVSLMQITAVVLATGQTVVLMYFGVVLVVCGFMHSSRWQMVLGLTILLLKPQIGVALCFALLMFKRHHVTLFWTGGITFLLTLPALVSTGPIETMRSFLGGLSKHSSFPSNIAEFSTGLKNLVAHTIGAAPSSTLYMLIAIGILMVIGAIVNLKSSKLNEDMYFRSQISYLMFALSVLAFLSPIHEYDMLVLLPILMLATICELKVQAALLVIFLLMSRAGNLANIMGYASLDDERLFVSAYYTLMLIILIFVTARNLVHQLSSATSD